MNESGAAHGREPSKPPPQTIGPTGISSAETFGESTVWKTFRFAPMWFADAVHQARAGGGADERRREIVFAVCSAESCIVEWVRDELLRGAFPQLSNFFPPGKSEGVTDKWKQVCSKAIASGLLPSAPSFSGQVWQEFTKLVNLRNGLIHARSSRPETTGVPDKEMPHPSKGDLDSMKPGWPTRSVAALIRSLHAASRAHAPPWVVDP